MKRFLFIIASVFVLGLASCDSGQTSGEIPAQPFTNFLTAIRAETGELTGRILFPSEYTQRSIRFTLGKMTFVSHPDGRFHITRIPTGDHVFLVKMKGYEPVSETLTIAPNETFQMEPLRLIQARGAVLGRLITDNGRSAKGLVVHLEPEGGVSVSDQDGIFQFLGVGAGDHLLRVKDVHYFAGNKRFALKANERRNLGNIKVYRQTRTNQPTARLNQ